MATYIKVTVTAVIKVQDPAPDEEEMEEIKEGTVLYCPHELTEEKYEFAVIDAD